MLFSVGLAGSINEVWLRDGPERPATLVFLAGMMGLPAFLWYDEKRTNGKKEEGSE